MLDTPTCGHTTQPALPRAALAISRRDADATRRNADATRQTTCDNALGDGIVIVLVPFAVGIQVQGLEEIVGGLLVEVRAQ